MEIDKLKASMSVYFERKAQDWEPAYVMRMHPEQAQMFKRIVHFRKPAARAASARKRKAARYWRK